MTTPAILQQAVEGLTYQSETDAPWETVSWPKAQGEPTAQKLLPLGHYKPHTPVVEEPLDGFFAPLIQEQDWFGAEEKAVAAKYRELLAVVKAQLHGPKVFRVGQRKVSVYIVGSVSEGGWAGLKTMAVET